MKKVLWVSRHKPLAEQLSALEVLYGSVEVHTCPIHISNVNDIIKKYKELNCNEMVVVAPLSVLQKLCEAGYKPLYAEMERVPAGEGSVKARGITFKFKAFKRLLAVKMEFGPL